MAADTDMEIDINMDMDMGTAADTDTDLCTFKMRVNALNLFFSSDSERFKNSTFQNCRSLTRFKS
jgi:hypothetical protein